MGYKVALWRDAGDEPVDCDLMLVGQYPGYARACNTLISQLIDGRADALWFVCAGDDMLPDQSKRANEIAGECIAHFAGTFGVMQPTGDGYGAERIAGSAWIGRDWCLKMYGGKGPLWHEYLHMFVDSELMDAATLTGTFWQRHDLSQKHNHWGRIGKPMPKYLTEANSPQHWQKYMGLYEARKAQGFPGLHA